MKPYNKNLKLPSRDLRSNMTDVEQLLWSRLRRKQILGLQFYRQKSLLNYIVDFYCPAVNLVIECDSGQHYTEDGLEAHRNRELTLNELIVASRPNLRYPDAPEMDAVVMVNPEILEFSQATCFGEEGCLSVPNERGQVERAQMVKVRYYTLQGEVVETSYEGFPARIVQHEVEHLDGVLRIVIVM